MKSINTLFDEDSLLGCRSEASQLFSFFLFKASWVNKLHTVWCEMVLTATGVIFSSDLILPGQSRPVLPTDGHTGRVQCKSFQVHFPQHTENEWESRLTDCLTVTLKEAVKLQPARHKSSPPLPRCSSERCHVTKGRLPTWERRERERGREREREEEREAHREREA